MLAENRTSQIPERENKKEHKGLPFRFISIQKFDTLLSFQPADNEFVCRIPTDPNCTCMYQGWADMPAIVLFARPHTDFI